MANSRLYMEKAGGRSPNTASFSIQGGAKTSRTFYIGDDGQRDPFGAVIHTAVTSITEVHNAIKEILGHSERHDDTLRIKRTRPMADPEYYYLHAESIGNIAGIGRPTLTAAHQGLFQESPQVDNFQLYPCYEFSGVCFTQRPYRILPDSAITTGSLIYADENGDEDDLSFAREWFRYVDVETIPSSEFLTAQIGNMKFNVASGSAPDDRTAGSGQIRMLMRKKLIKITWYQVPYNYIDGSVGDVLLGADSYIYKAIGCVNQYDWWRYKKGTMLLEAVGVQRYSPLFPTPIEDVDLNADGAEVFSVANAKLSNITFVFSYTNPPLGDDADGNEATPTIPAHILGYAGPIQTVPAGHNLVPYAHQMQWFYAQTQDLENFTRASRRPIYPSFPMQLIFTDPGI